MKGRSIRKSCWSGAIGVIIVVIAVCCGAAFRSGEWSIALKYGAALLSCYFMGLMTVLSIFGTISHFTGSKDFDGV